jgi:transposase-like protein
MTIPCPKCGNSHVSHRGTRRGKQRYQCQKCYKYFNGEIQSEKEINDNFPAVLVMDIETLPMIVYIWDTNIYNVSVNKEQVIEDWTILCWSAKWLEDDRIISACLTSDEAKNRDDKRICDLMWKLFDDADVIIAHNGKRFDIPKLNTRWWKHKLQQPSSYKVIDTLEAARKAFSVTWNSLDYLGEYLGLGRKLKTEFGLWRECDHGDKKALVRMQEYNQTDVILLEDVYLKMRGWIPNHPKFTAYEKVIGVCPVCFSPNIKNIGYYQAPVQKYAEFRCEDCRAIWHNTKAEK